MVGVARSVAHPVFLRMRWRKLRESHRPLQLPVTRPDFQNLHMRLASQRITLSRGTLSLTINSASARLVLDDFVNTVEGNDLSLFV